MSLTEEELAELGTVKRKPGRPPGSKASSNGGAFVCTECEPPRTFLTEPGLKSHQRSAHAPAGGSPPAPPPNRTPPGRTPGEAILKEEIDKLVGNLTMVGGFAAAVGFVHTGVALMGIQDESGTRWVVRSRSVLAGEVLLERARHDLRIFEAVRRFNSLFQLTKEMELAASLIAVGAADAGVPVETGFKLGGLEVQPIPMLVGDVVEYVAAWKEAQAEEAAAGAPPESSPNGAPAAGGMAEAETVKGGVQGT